MTAKPTPPSTAAHDVDVVATAFDNAPLDERPGTDEELREMAEARADAKAGAPWVPGEQVSAALATGNLDALRGLIGK